MKKGLVAYFEETKEKLITKCIKCGRCITECKIMAYAGVSLGPADIQQGILDFLSGGTPLSGDSELKVRACMRCFGCFDIGCPIEVDSLTINELVNRERELQKEIPWEKGLYPDHEKNMRAGTAPEEYARITTLSVASGSDVAFFPGCNVYRQPEKLLSALAVLDAVGKPYTFIPGITYCCGMAPGRLGHEEWVQDWGEKWINLIRELGVSTVVLWCPTCICHIEARNKIYSDMPCTFMTYGQYLLDNLDRLRFKGYPPHKITYHEPCKSSYMGLDTESVRGVLAAVPGAELVEMAHIREEAICCGAASVSNAPETGGKVSVRRLEEAKATGCDKLIDVCHSCHLFLRKAQRENEGFGDFEIVNYADYLAQALDEEAPHA